MFVVVLMTEAQCSFSASKLCNMVSIRPTTPSKAKAAVKIWWLEGGKYRDATIGFLLHSRSLYILYAKRHPSRASLRDIFIIHPQLASFFLSALH